MLLHPLSTTFRQELVSCINQNLSTVIIAICLPMLILILLWLAVEEYQVRNASQRTRRPALPMASFAGDLPASTSPLSQGSSSAQHHPHEPDHPSLSDSGDVEEDTTGILGTPSSPTSRLSLKAFLEKRRETRKEKAHWRNIRRCKSTRSFDAVDYSGELGRIPRWARHELSEMPASPGGTPDPEQARRDFQRMDEDFLYDMFFAGADKKKKLRDYLDLVGNFPRRAMSQPQPEDTDLITGLMERTSIGERGEPARTSWKVKLKAWWRSKH